MVFVGYLKTHHAYMSVHCLDAPVGPWYQEFRVNEFLYGKDNTIFHSKSDRSPDCTSHNVSG